MQLIYRYLINSEIFISKFSIFRGFLKVKSSLLLNETPLDTINLFFLCSYCKANYCVNAVAIIYSNAFMSPVVCSDKHECLCALRVPEVYI